MTRVKIAITVVAVGMVVIFAYNANLISAFDRSLLTKQNFLSEKELSNIDLGSEHKVLEFLDENPDLIRKLSDGIQSKRLNSEFSEADLNKLSLSISVLHSLFVAARDGVEHEQFDGFEREKPKLSDYLTAYVSLKREQGKGVLSHYDSVTQFSLSVATKLLLELQQNQGIDEKISHLAEWYVLERQSPAKVRVFEVSLLHNAWVLSAENLKLKLDDFDIESDLRRSSDLIRLIGDDNQSVAMNAAALVGYFLPENAVTGIRFQLARSHDKQFSFLLLDALKSYGQYRNQFEPQLNKMLRMTSDSDLQHKIMETINHLHGRSNELLSKGRQTK